MFQDTHSLLRLSPLACPPQLCRRQLLITGMLAFVTTISLGQAVPQNSSGSLDVSIIPKPVPDTSEQIRLNSTVPPPASTSAKRDTCFLPPLHLVQPQVVTSAALGASGKAKKEYEAACSALERKKLEDAEKHLRKAVKESPRYPAAWVTLGQLLVAGQKTEEGREACSQAAAADTTYVAGYLCLADIAARANAWDEVLKLSTRALELDPGNNVVGYEYNAAANLNFHKLDQAEKSALRALQADTTHSEPRVHFVLAQIYEAKGDMAREAEHLREYLKLATNPGDIEMVKKVLEGLDKRMSE